MRRTFTALFSALVLSASLLSGCGTSKETASAAPEEAAVSETAASAVSASSKEETEETAATSAESETDSTSADAPAANAYGLEDGEYTADIDTDSSMFHINEALDGKGTLTVKDGEMTIHMTLAGTGILNLYQGSAEDAQAEDAVLLEPVTDTVTYSDGSTEEVYGFDVPCPVLDEEFPVALVGKKGNWYDHTVTVSNPVKAE